MSKKNTKISQYLAYSPVFIYIKTCVLSKFKQYSNSRTL